MIICREKSLKKEVKYRLIKHISFLKNELEDYETFVNLTYEEYDQERNKRRNVERWVENIVNSSIDIARIILVSEGLNLPDTYKELINSLSCIPNFNDVNSKKLSGWVKLRNIMVHEYLDIRWSSIKEFISESKPLYENFLKSVKKYLELRTDKK
ncbi:MAG: hypothetical protein SCARUB_03276 [Candidatus Scalindua rubra]|uniref:DUF86 domain-containing protein n=1 Tax=Candidatus Scalindua rubra TaxID=1872076 RepID=A0A1E3X7L0_9BACT|nr:MAG: hypothetical protein SCARUB_03276 [Candidatus Scalindua rubra]